jgi:hypothetical protein
MKFFYKNKILDKTGEKTAYGIVDKLKEEMR